MIHALLLIRHWQGLLAVREDLVIIAMIHALLLIRHWQGLLAV